MLPCFNVMPKNLRNSSHWGQDPGHWWQHSGGNWQGWSSHFWKADTWSGTDANAGQHGASSSSGSGQVAPVAVGPVNPSEPDTEQSKHDNEVAQINHLKELFWASEEQSRLRNAALTVFERHQVTHHCWQSDADKGQVKRVLSHFGEVRGVTKLASLCCFSSLLKSNTKPGDACSLRSPDFSLCKHLFLAACMSNLDLVTLAWSSAIAYLRHAL